MMSTRIFFHFFRRISFFVYFLVMTFPITGSANDLVDGLKYYSTGNAEIFDETSGYRSIGSIYYSLHSKDQYLMSQYACSQSMIDSQILPCNYSYVDAGFGNIYGFSLPGHFDRLKVSTQTVYENYYKSIYESTEYSAYEVAKAVIDASEDIISLKDGLPPSNAISTAIQKAPSVFLKLAGADPALVKSSEGFFDPMAMVSNTATSIIDNALHLVEDLTDCQISPSKPCYQFAILTPSSVSTPSDIHAKFAINRFDGQMNAGALSSSQFAITNIKVEIIPLDDQQLNVTYETGLSIQNTVDANGSDLGLNSEGRVLLPHDQWLEFRLQNPLPLHAPGAYAIVLWGDINGEREQLAVRPIEVGGQDLSTFGLAVDLGHSGQPLGLFDLDEIANRNVLVFDSAWSEVEWTLTRIYSVNSQLKSQVILQSTTQEIDLTSLSNGEHYVLNGVAWVADDDIVFPEKLIVSFSIDFSVVDGKPYVSNTINGSDQEYVFKDPISKQNHLVSVKPFISTYSVKKMAAGRGFALAINDRGDLFQWGASIYGKIPEYTWQPVQIGEDFISVSAGENSVIGLKSDGTLWGWGGNSYGELGIGDTEVKLNPVYIGSEYIAVSSGAYHALGLKNNGDLFAWGKNDFGQIGVGGTLVDTNILFPQFVGTGFVAIASGHSHSLGLKSNGELWAWGHNGYGQLGDGTTINRSAPVLIGTGFLSIASGPGSFVSFGLKSNGDLYSWGMQDFFQLGVDANVAYLSIPTFVGDNYKNISSGSRHVVAIRNDDELWSWGHNSFGQLGTGDNIEKHMPTYIESGYTDVESGFYFSIGLKSDEKLYASGYNRDEQLADGSVINRNVFTPIIYDLGFGELTDYPPVLYPPENITVPAMTSAGTPSSHEMIQSFIGGVAAFDTEDGEIEAITNNSPSTFPIGITQVVFSVTDSDGNTVTAKSNVTVSDQAPPLVDAPDNIVVRAVDAYGVQAGVTEISSFLSAASAYDNVNGVILSITNNAPSIFPLGTTVVTFSATDSAGNTGTSQATVTVADQTPPSVSAPAGVTVGAISSSGVASSDERVAAFLSAASATDNVDGTMGVVSNNVPSMLPLGTTVVTFSATDSAGNTGTAQSSVTVADLTPPVVTAPASITVPAASSAGVPSSDDAIVRFLGGATVTDNVDGTISAVTHNAPPVFPVGSTQVVFSATDAAGNTSSAVGVVTVESESVKAQFVPMLHLLLDQ